jgi:DNA primase
MMSRAVSRSRDDDGIVEKVAAANDIVEIISQFVPMKRAGRNFKACCPFHGEKTPSFMVQPEKQLFHCFGCQAGGDVFSFLMRYENLSFPEALKVLADRANITLPERRFAGGEDNSQKEKIYEIYQQATVFYQKLFQSDAGRDARAYLAKRGITQATIDEFKIGWAVNDWRTLYDHLTKKGYPEALLKQSSLVQQSPKGNYYDTFRGRVLFPIMNLQGKVVAFGGRLIADAEGPKYLNSPENPVFSKRRELFGLNLAKKFIDREWPTLILVEGYKDFLALYQQGFKNTVATLGTALGEDHVRLMKRFVDEVTVVYDGDKAGEAAALRGLEILLEGGMHVKLVSLPKGYDPDDFVHKEGEAAFRELLKTAQDFFDYKLQALLKKYPRADALGLAKISREMLETFQKIKNPVILSEYFKRLSRELRVDEASLKSEFSNISRRTGIPHEKRAAEAPPKPVVDVIPKEEVLLVALMIEKEAFAEEAGAKLDPGMFQSKGMREAFVQVIETAGQGEKRSAVSFLHKIDDASCREQLIAALAAFEEAAEKEKIFDDCLKKIKKNKITGRLEELRRLISEAERSGTTPQLLAYTKEYNELLHRSRSEQGS